MSNFRPACYLLASAVLLLACAEAPRETAQKEPEPAPEPVEGQKAFYQTYVAARGWAQDAEGLRLESVQIPEVPSKGALFGAWRATFASRSKSRVAIFNYSVVDSVESGKLQKGVFQDHEEGYVSGGRDEPWPVAALKTTSTKALEVAMEQRETKQYLAKSENKDKAIFFLLEKTNRHPNVAWRVVWGHSVSTSDFSVFVDASTGEFLEVMR